MSETIFRRNVLCGTCLIVMVLAGCGKNEGDKVEPSDATDAPFESEASKQWETPTDDECRELAEKLELAAQSRDADAINDLIDWEALLNRATGGIDGVESVRREFAVGVQDSIRRGNGLAHEVIADVDAGGSYRFLKLRVRDDRKSILFRFIGSKESPGLAYHDMLVARKPRGTIRIVDVYISTTGEFFSSTLRRLFLPVAVSKSRSALQSLTNKESEFVKYIDQFGQMGLAVKRKQFRRVLQIYSRLPESVQKDKNILMLRLLAAKELDDEAYLDAMGAFQKYHPGDPCLDIILIDAFIINEEYDKSLAAVDRLDEWVGGDAYLDVIRSNICLIKEDYAKVKKYAERAIKAEPTLVEAYWALVDVSLAESNFEETSRLLRLLNDKFEIEFDDLTTVPEYSEYVKSPQHREWLESRKGK
ncbi:MAG: hypothetical protein IID44_18405 [Planctomycetes bacterium]|nr:hypothetical protein [Planctomycetota bacterium]